MNFLTTESLLIRLSKNRKEMIIGISGKMSSGKDTVANIIRELTGNTREKHSTLLGKVVTINTTSWEIKRFADKVKDIVCLLIGCSREQLEDREFKEKELGQEWEQTYNNYVNKPTIRQMTPRKLLQLVGTNCGRNIIHPNIWVNSLMSEYQLIDMKTYGDPSADAKYPSWIIPDVRFPNEVYAVKKKGIVIRVVRNTKEFSDHFSETALDEYQNWDYVIYNLTTLENLKEKVKQILHTENLIPNE